VVPGYLPSLPCGLPNCPDATTIHSSQESSPPSSAPLVSLGTDAAETNEEAVIEVEVVLTLIAVENVVGGWYASADKLIDVELEVDKGVAAAEEEDPVVEARV
jgi:hypothetical protein